MKFVGTYIIGFEKIIPNLLKIYLKDVNVINEYNGMIIFFSNDIEGVFKLHFLNNIYYLINSVKVTNYNIDINIKKLAQSNINYNDINNLLNYIKRKMTFKIKAFNENQPTRFDYRLVSSLEKELERMLKIRISNTPDLEFIFSLRRENIMLYMFKISYNRLTEKDIKKGSLRPEMSYLLSYLAGIKSTDIVLDPFCGSGSIPKIILKHFKYNMVFASDNDEKSIKLLKSDYKSNNKRFFIKCLDATNLNNFEDNFIDIIITDPPWNIYNSNDINYFEFYIKMLNEFSRILKPSGKIVILMGNIETFEKSLSKIKGLAIDDIYSTLVNGKKANAYVIRKGK